MVGGAPQRRLHSAQPAAPSQVQCWCQQGTARWLPAGRRAACACGCWRTLSLPRPARRQRTRLPPGTCCHDQGLAFFIPLNPRRLLARCPHGQPARSGACVLPAADMSTRAASQCAATPKLCHLAARLQLASPNKDPAHRPALHENLRRHSHLVRKLLSAASAAPAPARLAVKDSVGAMGAGGGGALGGGGGRLSASGAGGGLGDGGGLGCTPTEPQPWPALPGAPECLQSGGACRLPWQDHSRAGPERCRAPCWPDCVQARASHGRGSPAVCRPAAFRSWCCRDLCAQDACAWTVCCWVHTHGSRPCSHLLHTQVPAAPAPQRCEAQHMHTRGSGPHRWRRWRGSHKEPDRCCGVLAPGHQHSKAARAVPAAVGREACSQPC